MLLLLVPIIWLAVTTVVVAVCRIAAAGPRVPDDARHGGKPDLGLL